MANSPALHPSLWRTSRVLANRQRLRILELLFRQPGLTVSAVAEQLRLPRPVASQYLRALNARGLLQVERKGSWVRYRPGADESVAHAQALFTALRETFRNDPNPIERTYRLVTAFTNERRMAVYRILSNGQRTYPQLLVETRMSHPALSRHLRKLEARGFVQHHDGSWRTQPGAGTLARTLAQLSR